MKKIIVTTACLGLGLALFDGAAEARRFKLGAGVSKWVQNATKFVKRGGRGLFHSNAALHQVNGGKPPAVTARNQRINQSTQPDRRTPQIQKKVDFTQMARDLVPTKPFDKSGNQDKFSRTNARNTARHTTRRTNQIADNTADRGLKLWSPNWQPTKK